MNTPEAPHSFSVSEALQLAKTTLEKVTLTIIGEVSELSIKPGYKAVYFSIKDEASTLPCQIWLSRYESRTSDLKIGDKVELVGRFTLYPAKGRMSFDVFSFNFAGEGDLRLKVANLAKKLEAEGLTADSRKRQIPPYPEKIGVVTSPRGAAIHDVLRTLRRRFPLASVVFAGVPVEGTGAPEGLIRALRCVDSVGVDVILLVRGGGSFEDLMPFNDEQLARAIVSLTAPVVTGIGHEPDTTIADLVADLRASTPTAAAETVVPAKEALLRHFDNIASMLKTRTSRNLETNRLKLSLYSRKPYFCDPRSLYEKDFITLDRYHDTFLTLGSHLIDKQSHDLKLRASRLEDLSPLKILSRGYTVARDKDKKIIHSVDKVSPGDGISILFADGIADCTVEAITPKE